MLVYYCFNVVIVFVVFCFVVLLSFCCSFLF